MHLPARYCRSAVAPTDQIRQLVAQKPGLKAQQIAAELGIERAHVVTILHGLAGGDLVQDNAYRWWPATRARASTAAAPAPRTFLANLCRYYLEALSRESGSAVSLPVADEADYVALPALPFEQPLELDRAVKKVVQRVARERGQLTLYLGYPVRVREREERRLEPVLLYPIEESFGEQLEALRPASAIPLFNLEVVKTPAAVGSGNIVEEAIQLAEELGLAGSEDELPQWDEIILRLQRCRPDWQWREDLDPYRLSQEPPVSKLQQAGIYNRAILFAGTRSPFTYGLEIELRKLMQLEEEAVRNTALGYWLRGGSAEPFTPEDRPIVEVLPLNSEQRQAVVQGLSAPLTVVTGPPGTGKSQVVTSLLANVAWQGANALFSSKNNHAVDVVESRTNDLGPFPLLLRLGREEHHARIAQHLTSALAESASTEVAERYAWLMRSYERERARFAGVQGEIAGVCALRNSVDELERSAEPARELFGAERFARLLSANLDGVSEQLQALAQAIGSAAKSRLLPDPMKARRAQRIAALAAELVSTGELLGLPPPATESDLAAWSQRLELARQVRSYGEMLERLRSVRPLERLAGELTRIATESADNAHELWQTWLRLWPSRWRPEDRKLLSEFVSLLQILASGERFEEGGGKKVLRRYYSLFPRVAKIVPCWAVTSLSARGRLPFHPGLFDVAIIDEASQCDIASALPLLYRARRAVIIGDPLQLRHVTTVSPQQDRLMLAAHGLAEGGAAWAFSVNSLFDLARSVCLHEDLVNLRDHHRSHRDIIGFSNRHFYRRELRIATDHEALKRPPTPGPAVRWVDVRGKVVRPPGGGALNNPEAQALVEELKALVLNQSFSGSIGVVTPFRAQANRVRTMVQHDHALAHGLASHQFVVDTVHGFQGDERDVILFSPVASVGIADSAVRFLKTHGNLFNVAITRARSELIVVGDRQAALDSGVGYLAGFAEYARVLGDAEIRPRTDTAHGPEYPVVPRPDLVSEWERVFYRAAYAAGLRPVPQFEEAPYTLDFALFEGSRKLDIEIDGEHYHRNWDGQLCRRDQIRSRRLIDAGWDIMRFWVYEVRDDLAGCIRRVEEWKGGLKPTAG